jgi:ABC-type glutathione transport system ATPase component
MSAAIPFLVEARHLVKHYARAATAPGRHLDPIKAVDDVSFAIKPGEAFGLEGESGSGKSTVGQPTSALDVSVQAQVIDLLMELKAQLKLLYLFISHNLSLVEYVCDRTLVLYAGRAAELSQSFDLHRAPARSMLTCGAKIDRPKWALKRTPRSQWNGGYGANSGPSRRALRPFKTVARPTALDPELPLPVSQKR